MKRLVVIVLAMFMFAPNIDSSACSRVVYHGPNNTVLTGRTMDWKYELGTHLWILPRGAVRNGAVGGKPVTWTSKYGSVVASAYDICSPDGMNEKGLMANMLWLEESVFPLYDGKMNAMSIAVWAQYMLDNYATVAEAVEGMRNRDFEVVTESLDGIGFVGMHLSLSDSSGDSAIFEYIDGKMVIHHSRDYQVMTNSPSYDQQLAIAGYWESVDGSTFLPGTNRASDRFARASYYINNVMKTDDERMSVATVFSVIRNLSVPYGYNTSDKPNISSTRWRVVADQKNLVYYFENVLSPNVIHINLKEVDFSRGASVRKLELTNDADYAGNVLNQFKDSEPFVFLGISGVQI